MENDLKPALIRLLLEDFKQSRLIDGLEDFGIEMSNLKINLSDIVFDLIGFPKDNTMEYNLNPHIEGEHNNEGLKLIDDSFFSRDYISDEWFSITSRELKNIMVVRL